MNRLDDDVERQRKYYADTAACYDELHTSDDKGEHFMALSFLLATIDYLGVRSILDIGSGTGRAVRYIKERRPDIRVLGIEPVKELREQGYLTGLSDADLIEGDATRLDFAESEFDLVCEFGALHHMPRPDIAVSEMLRVADKAIFISDSNNFGQGSFLSRTFKQIMNSLGLWKLVDLIRTKGKGYMISEGDGLYYSYSVFNNYNLIRNKCKSFHILNTKDASINPYRTASHVAILGIKK